MSGTLRKFGSKLVGSIPWGTHLCQFYETKQDLIDILVPYFAEGLRSNEFCMWVTSPPLEVEEARKALQESVPNLNEYIKKGQIEIISYNNWYLLEGKFDSKRVLQGWLDKEKAALEHGFEGLRLTGNTFWIERDLWNSFVDYEEAVNSVIGEHHMIAVCTYCLLSCSGRDVVDVVRNHVGTLIKQGKKWTLVENATRRKLTNGALKLTEHKYSALFANMQDAFAYHKVLFDEKGKPVDYVFLEANGAFEKFTGLKGEEIIGKKVTEVFPGIEKDPADLIGTYGKVAITGVAKKFETFFGPLNKWYSISAYSPEKGYFVATFEDITDRKKAESQVEGLARFPSENPYAVLRIDSHGKILYSNPASQQLSNFVSTHVGKNSSESWKSHIKEAVSTNKQIEFEESYENRTFLYKIAPIISEGYVNVYGTEITEHKKAEEAVRKQAELIDLSPDAIVVRKFDGTITFWSKGAEKLYGWTKEEAVGQDINKLLKPQLPQSLKEIQDALKTKGKWSGEVIHVCKDGNRLVVQSYWLGKFGSDGKILEMLESNVDVTERIQMQLKLEESAVRLEEYATQMEELANQRAAQLKDAERLAAIGATAGMVGHDIRNPLQAITGDIYLAKTELTTIPEGEEKKNIQESLAEIEKNVDYINKIVADLQDFARPLKPNAEETDLKRIIDDLLSKNGLPENVKVSVKVETGKVVADSTFINRIMYNLVNNAVQAMPEGGKLTIHTYKEANDTVISVKDTGVGIPEAVKGKLFTPMFTTKSKGQGFGLAVIKRMTEALGGTVSFESQEGKGTTFIICLPQKT